ncbi:hypothetical protein KO506_11930 [Polaribacter vadi]|uniref:DUF5777 family beta-barrel protein n=1 Tax=Polaribacter TaxID=52959 RepID=UPI001C08CA81|nr:MULTISPECIES: DUF5777 family beta-barrel protein [Polaribacter]MBU3012115.1 hypothetical protein [Polaribacter vadi]MDO6741931.1 DUF5777 family beta-barrel protein [Polaribacter sp. 1_MG-2023]
MKNKNIFKLFLLCMLLVHSSLNAQGLLDKLENEFPDKPVYEIATFKTTRIGLGHSIETRKKGALEISLYNRYWNIPDFKGQRFLADVVSIRYGLDYAFSDNFTLGLGYTNHDKISDGFFKYKLLKQRQNSNKGLFSITLIQGISHRKVEGIYNDNYEQNNASSSSRYAFTSQVLIARKINTELSLQVAPTFIQRAENPLIDDTKNQFAIAFGGRHKIGGHASIVSEYFYVTNPLKSIETYNAFMIGLNWELSHLLLQFQMTNARNFAEDTFITQTRNNFNAKDGNFHFGFNATWVLQTKKKKL